MTLHEIVEELQRGNSDIINSNLLTISEEVMDILNYPDETIKNHKELLDKLVDLITIGNITYNYMDTEILPIDNEIYDQLAVKLQRIDFDKFNSGAKPVFFESKEKDTAHLLDRESKELIKPFMIMSDDDRKKLDESFFPSILEMNKSFDIRMEMEKPFTTAFTYGNNISKRLRNTAHNYPNLVGTLKKCKIVLDKQAKDLGMYEKENVTILERDFFVPLVQRGIIDINNPIEMIGTIKYDGVSIEADVTDHIISARTRGDTNYNEASDLTPIFEGYKFPNAPKLNNPIGMKFEAIILYRDLIELNKRFGLNYINGRTAIIGILGSSNAREMRDYITLVPLQVDFGPDTVQPDRLTEILFLNKYYANREYLRYTVIKDVYVNLLFYIKKYVEEAEYFRQWSKFMYDGVVLEFSDPSIRNILGRKNSINLYAMAVKFNPMKKLTTFTGYSYTIGQNGVITPMIHYKPIEFLGSIHTKSSGSSYERFRQLNLYIGDTIEVTYVNDVMPYVTKPDIEVNRKNHCRDPLPEEMFPERCPCCGSTLVLSTGGKTMYCPNMNCGERKLQRMSNMIFKLGIKDFSEASVQLLPATHFYQLMEMKLEDFDILGPTNKFKLYGQLQELKLNPLSDYRIIGALGFSNIADKKWKIIFSVYTLVDIYNLFIKEESTGLDNIMNSKGCIYENVTDLLSNIKGIGPVTARVISDEMEFFKDDIKYIIDHNMYIPSKIGLGKAKYQIRFSGFRDQLLCDALNNNPEIDCDDNGSVTKNTSFLLIPYVDFTSSKTAKAQSYGIPIITVKDFLENTGKYIPELNDVEF